MDMTILQTNRKLVKLDQSQTIIKNLTRELRKTRKQNPLENLKTARPVVDISRHVALPQGDIHKGMYRNKEAVRFTHENIEHEQLVVLNPIRKVTFKGINSENDVKLVPIAGNDGSLDIVQDGQGKSYVRTIVLIHLLGSDNKARE